MKELLWKGRSLFLHSSWKVEQRCWVIELDIGALMQALVFPCSKRAARLERDIAQANYETIEMTIRAAKRVTEAQYDKLQRKLVYYRQTALPTAREQQKGAAAAYQLGATDYVGFIQTMGDAVQTELDYWTAYEQLLQTQIDLQYPNI